MDKQFVTIMFLFFIQFYFSWDAHGLSVRNKSSCQEDNTAYLGKVNKDYATYQVNKRENKDDLENNLTFARQILEHYKNHFNINCSSVFGGNLANQVCEESVIKSGLASDRKEMARELLEHCSFRAYGKEINQMANNKINSLEGRPSPPSCENDIVLRTYYTVEDGCKEHNIKTSDDWGCAVYNQLNGLSLTEWPQADPLELKKTMAQYAVWVTSGKVPPTCKVKIEGSFFNNFICSKEDIEKNEEQMKVALSQFEKDKPDTYITDQLHLRFNSTSKLLKYCSSDIFPEARKWALKKSASFEEMKKHQAIKLKKKQYCTDVDLRKGKNFPPIRDQDSLGWCFAYVGADFLSFYMGETLSALALSVKNYQEELEKEKSELSQLSSGNLKILFERLKNHSRLCTEKQVNSEDINFTESGQYELKKTLESIEKFFNKEEGNDEVAFYCSMRNHLAQLFPGLNMQDFIDILKTESKYTVIIESIKKSCDEKNSVPLPKDLSIVFDEDMSLEKLHEILDKEELFAALFDVSLIVSGMERGNHMANIVGRRYNEDKNRCEFLLRNSWGETCYPQYKHDCDEGYLWIPEQEFIEKVDDIYYKI